MPLAMQAKLLRALETRIVERVGSMLPIAVDVRLIAATSVDLIAALDRGNFRSDLLYRVDVVRIVVPPLADHAADIPLLLAHFATLLIGPPVGFDIAAVALLMRQPWHGNVCELKSFVERAQAHFSGETITAEVAQRLLPLTNSAVARSDCSVVAMPALFPAMRAVLTQGNVDLKSIFNTLEQAHIVAALQASGAPLPRRPSDSDCNAPR